MKRVSTFAYNATCFLGGAILIVAGWWISMLNISIDRYSAHDFTNFWTLLGLVFIFLGAYLPVMLIKWHERKLRRAIPAALTTPVGGDGPDQHGGRRRA